MDSRERVFLALNHDEPDRVPVDFWATSGAWDVIARSSGMTPVEFRDLHDVDFLYIEGPRYIGTPLEPGLDIWGVRRRDSVVRTRFGSETYSEVAGSPLGMMDTVEQVERYEGWPDPDDFDYSVVRDQALAVRERGRIAVFMGDRLNRVAQLKPAMYLRGVDQILLDLALNPEIAKAIFERIVSFYDEYLARVLEAADGFIDIVCTGDDFGQQNGLLLSPEMWSGFLAPGFARYMKIIHTFGATSMHHTCGDVRLITSLLHSHGLDILQSLQPEAMADAYQGMKRNLGDTLSFHGGISIQQTLPHGTIADIRKEVSQRVERLGRDGGYILCTAHNVQADCSYENISALLEAYQRYGRYT